MATNICYSRSIVHPTMATNICYTGSIVHFRYLFPKTIANPVLGHGMTKLLKPPHTTRIGIRASHNTSRREVKCHSAQDQEPLCQSVRNGSGTFEYDCHKKILGLLKLNLPEGDTKLTEHAAKLSKKLEHIGTHEEDVGGLVYLCREILGREHILPMWKIAGYNLPNKAADYMLPLKKIPSMKWVGKGEKIIKGILGEKRTWDGKNKQEPLPEFPLKGDWEMELQRCANGEAYNVVLKGQKDNLLRLLTKKKSGKDLALVFVEKNLKGVPAGVEPFDLAFVFRADDPWPSSNNFVIYMRAAGPNVLVGRAWTGGENNKCLWGEVVLVKRK